MGPATKDPLQHSSQQLPAWSPRACFALRARKWLRKGARPFALTFELAQSKSLPIGSNLFAGSQVVTHGRLRAFAPGL